MGYLDTVEISTLSGFREPSPIDDPSKLVADIKQRGQETPILIRQDLHIIEGLRRVRALQSLGVEQVQAFVADTWLDIPPRLDDARDDSNFRLPLIMRPHDVVHLYHAVEDLGTEALRASRAVASSVKRGSRQRRERLVAWRAQFFAALDLDDHAISDGRFVLNAMKDIPPGEEEVYRYFYEESRAGRITLQGARRGMERYALRGDVLRAQDQKRILDKFIHESEANYRAFKSLGSLTGNHTQEELEGWIRGIKQARDQYTVMINVLKRRLGK